MQPKIFKIEQKRFIGQNLKMNLINNTTGQLWQGFSPRIHEIHNKVSADRYSLQIYPADYFHQFNPQTEFNKWAAVEVNDITEIPTGMDILTINAGLYAVFHYTGSSADKSIFQYIYGEWVPKSGYALDNRPHFEVLGKNYRNNDPTSEEDIYIPIKSIT